MRNEEKLGNLRVRNGRGIWTEGNRLSATEREKVQLISGKVTLTMFANGKVLQETPIDDDILERNIKRKRNHFFFGPYICGIKCGKRGRGLLNSKNPDHIIWHMAYAVLFAIDALFQE